MNALDAYAMSKCSALYKVRQTIKSAAQSGSTCETVVFSAADIREWVRGVLANDGFKVEEVSHDSLLISWGRP